MIQTLWKTVWRFPKKLGITPPYDPEMALLGRYHEEIEIERDTCIPLFIVALFTIVRVSLVAQLVKNPPAMRKTWV